MPSRRSYLAAICSATAALAGCGSRRIDTDEQTTVETDPDEAGAGSSETPTPTPDEESSPSTGEPSTEKAPTEDVESVLDIRSFGATVDGQTDDSRAVRRALLSADDGATIYFPPGETVVSADEYNAGILLDSSEIPSGLTLTGEGKDSVIRIADGQEKSHSIIRLIGEEPFGDLSVSRLRLDGNRAAQPGLLGHGILIYNDVAADQPANVRLRDLWIENFTQAGITTRRGGITISYCSISDCGVHGVNIGNGAPFSLNVPPVIVRRTFCTRNGKSHGTYGINCSGGNILVADCVCANNGQGTKTTGNSINVTYRRVLLRNNDYYGYTRAGSRTQKRSNVVFDDVVSVENGSGGFRLADDTDYTVPTNILASHNFGHNVFITNNARIQAERVWSNRAQGSVGVRANSEIGGRISQYFPYRNDDGALDVDDNLDINAQHRRDRTDIETVPPTFHVGADTRKHRKFGQGELRFL